MRLGYKMSSNSSFDNDYNSSDEYETNSGEDVKEKFCLYGNEPEYSSGEMDILSDEESVYSDTDDDDEDTNLDSSRLFLFLVGVNVFVVNPVPILCNHILAR